ncbi:MAG: hypothetical protein E6017_22305 [Kluyvera cryocrescens]|nr:hypothetical protein [Kluyvera cryocrescens]
MKTDVGSIVRTIVFILAWVNQFLATKNISPIPDYQLYHHWRSVFMDLVEK